MTELSRRSHGESLVDELGARLSRASIAANVTGAVVVFLFISFVLPVPVKYEHKWWPLALNGGLLALSGVTGIPLASHWLGRLWRDRVGWALEGRDPTPGERELTLRFPLTQQKIIAKMWLADAVFFAVVNATYSWQIAFNVGVTVALGSLVVVSLCFLLSERLLRPMTALALATGVPERPQLPGVMARALLSWTLATGVLLVGLAIVGAGALVNASYWDKGTLGWVVLVLAVTGLAVGLLAMTGLARSLADPLDGLRRAVARVEAGDLEHDVTVDDGSEVGLLQAGFNRMLAGLRERERLRDLFGRQVGEDVVRHALENGVKLGGEARAAAVLFVDLQGSTQLAQEGDPAEVVALLNAFFAIVVEVVAAHDGWVNKFEGDAALCVFGAPLADQACAGNALAAGRELAARLRSEIPAVVAGIGIAAGRVVAGNLGAARRFEYTVIGDPVNVAARLSELAKGDAARILASAAALEATGTAERERWELVRDVVLRGRSEPTAVAVPRSAGPRRREHLEAGARAGD